MMPSMRERASAWWSGTSASTAEPGLLDHVKRIATDTAEKARAWIYR